MAEADSVEKVTNRISSAEVSIQNKETDKTKNVLDETSDKINKAIAQYNRAIAKYDRAKVEYNKDIAEFKRVLEKYEKTRITFYKTYAEWKKLKAESKFLDSARAELIKKVLTKFEEVSIELKSIYAKLDKSIKQIIQILVSSGGAVQAKINFLKAIDTEFEKLYTKADKESEEAYVKYQTEKAKAKVKTGTTVKNTVETEVFSKGDEFASEYKKILAKLKKLSIESEKILSTHKKAEAEYKRAKGINKTEFDKLFIEYNQSRNDLNKIIYEVIKNSSQQISFYEKLLIFEIDSLKIMYPEFKKAYIRAENKANIIYGRWKKVKAQINKTSIIPKPSIH